MKLLDPIPKQEKKLLKKRMRLAKLLINVVLIRLMASMARRELPRQALLELQATIGRAVPSTTLPRVMLALILGSPLD